MTPLGAVSHRLIKLMYIVRFENMNIMSIDKCSEDLNTSERNILTIACSPNKLNVFALKSVRWVENLIIIENVRM